MNKKNLSLILAVIVVFFTIIILMVITGNKNQTTTVQPEKEGSTIGGKFILYSKDASWGPCPTENPNDCTEKIVIYNTGEIIVNEKQSEIETARIILLEETIEKTGIRDKKCDYMPVLDYQAEYYIHPKTITYPGCEEELEEIDKTVDEFIKQLKLQSAAPNGA